MLEPLLSNPHHDLRVCIRGQLTTFQLHHHRDPFAQYYQKLSQADPHPVYLALPHQ